MPLGLQLVCNAILSMGDEDSTNGNDNGASPVSPDRFDEDWLSSESLFASLSMVNRTSEPDSLLDILRTVKVLTEAEMCTPQ